MKKQTALQNLIQELNQFKKFPMVDQPTIDAAIEFAELRLKQEEDQIEGAWTDGRMLGVNGNIVTEYDNGNGYFNKTYGTK